ncbi:MAG: 2-oxoglutarate and iron-dependent oxygenase domain-containing protein [Pseudomonadota bacterium]
MVADIPLIDLTDLRRAPEASAGQAVVAEIDQACQDFGFFQVVGHGVPEALIARVWRETRAFFALPMADKRKLSRSRENPRGYYDRELTKNQRDRKEVLDFGMEPYPDLPSDHPQNTWPVDGHNRWPEVMPDFRATMGDYFRACDQLGHLLLRAFCQGMGEAPERLAPHFDADHTSFIRLNHYPLGDILSDTEAAAVTPLGDMALHHHSDAGVLTILLQDEIGGLQIFHNDAWIEVTPIPGAFVINVGDMMQVWSNDRYPAALHRVRPIRGAPRYSLPFFMNPSYRTDCAPLPSTLTAAAPHYRSINWGEFRQLRTDGDFADYGKEVQLSDYRLTG